MKHPNPREEGSCRAPGEVSAHLVMALIGSGLCAAGLAVALALPASFPGKAVAAGAVAGIAAWPVLRALGPGFRFGPADRVTLLRASLVVVLLAAVGEPYAPQLAGVAAGLATLAAALDGVDGWLARRTDTASAFGARFDMETDAALVLVLSVLAWQWHKAGLWILFAGMLRYVFAAVAMFLPWMRHPLPPSTRRRVVCVAQVVTLIACLAPAITPPYSALVAGAGLAALVFSFAVDTVWLAARARPTKEYART